MVLELFRAGRRSIMPQTPSVGYMRNQTLLSSAHSAAHRPRSTSKLDPQKLAPNLETHMKFNNLVTVLTVLTASPFDLQDFLACQTSRFT
jgi:hypothetical protein